MSRTTRWWSIGIPTMIGLFVVDRILKYYALYRLPFEGHFIGQSGIGLRLAQNSGIGYGLPLPMAIALILIVIVLLGMVGMVLYGWRRHRPGLGVGALAIVIGGTSNLIDRFRFDHVIDYLVVIGPSTFNIADILITIGAALLIWQLIRRRTP